MLTSKINWKREDYITLGKAVANFNKKVRELEAQEVDLKLPDELNYKNIKENTFTRSQFNNILKSLRRFTEEGAEDLFVTEGGERITQWEHNENLINTRRATRFIKSQIRELEKPIDKGNFSKAQMGSVELRNWVATLHSITKLEKERGYNYNRIKLNVYSLGRHDYKYAKSLIFRENFENALENLKNLDGYDLLMKKLNRYKNPVSFYNLIKNSNVFMDIFTYYDNSSGLVYGEFKTEQERFNQGLEDLGIVDDEKKRLYKKYDRQNNEELKKAVSYITDANDLFEFLSKYEKRK